MAGVKDDDHLRRALGISVAGSTKRNGELTEKQKAFCREYVKSGVGHTAAITAGYSERSAYVQANQNLKNDRVRAYIEQLRKPLMDKFEASAERIIGELATISFSRLDEAPGLKYSDKVAALNTLAKINKMFPDTNVNLKGNLAHRIVGLRDLLDELDGSDTGTGPAKSRVAEIKTR